MGLDRIYDERICSVMSLRVFPCMRVLRWFEHGSGGHDLGAQAEARSFFWCRRNSVGRSLKILMFQSDFCSMGSVGGAASTSWFELACKG